MGWVSFGRNESLQATAKEFAKNGVNVIVWDKDEERLKQSHDEVSCLLQNGCHLIQQCVDITNRLQVGSEYTNLMTLGS